MTARDEKILKIKAREMISIKPIIIKNPFETRNNGIFDEMSEAEVCVNNSKDILSLNFISSFG